MPYLYIIIQTWIELIVDTKVAIIDLIRGVMSKIVQLLQKSQNCQIIRPGWRIVGIHNWTFVHCVWVVQGFKMLEYHLIRSWKRYNSQQIFSNYTSIRTKEFLHFGGKVKSSSSWKKKLYISRTSRAVGRFFNCFREPWKSKSLHLTSTPSKNFAREDAIFLQHSLSFTIGSKPPVVPPLDDKREAIDIGIWINWWIEDVVDGFKWHDHGLCNNQSFYPRKIQPQQALLSFTYWLQLSAVLI